jgi:hypothetical protein
VMEDAREIMQFYVGESQLHRSIYLASLPRNLHTLS